MNTEELFIDAYKLPNPLENDEVYKLLAEIKKGSSKAKEKLIIHNIRLVLYEVTTKFQKVEYDKKELVSLGSLGLIKAIDTYDLSKGTEFSTYATRCIDNEILMFIRKLKKYQNVDSLDKIIYNDKDGNELKLGDTISDNTNLVEENENKELRKIVRMIVNELPDRDKEIIMLHFGFYNDRTYTQSEIADKLKLSQPYVSRLINRIVKKIGIRLNNNDVIETRQTQGPEISKLSANINGDEEKIKLKGRITKVPVSHSINEQTIDVSLQTNESLHKPDLSSEYYVKMKDIEKNDCIKYLELLKTPMFEQIMRTFTPKEVMIVSFKLGYIDGKYFSTKSISKFLQVEEDEIRKVTRKVLLEYKKYINNAINNVTEVVTDGELKIL